MIIDEALNSKTVGAIERHYLHAKKKHPYFCDRMLPAWAECNIKELVRRALDDRRASLKAREQDGNLVWNYVLDCDVWEVSDAIVNGDIPHAIEECYHAIAVLLRVVDVLEGRQTLGKPKKEGEVK